MARGTLRIAGAALIVLAVAVTLLSRRDRSPRRGGPASAQVSAPEGVRIRVQVMNATTTRGLARRATSILRDRGFDVVEMGTATEQQDSTLVLDRSGHPEWAEAVAAALGGARVMARPDSSRFLDVTVLLGRTWRPPAEPFYP